MTIVLQHQFWDLKVADEAFEVGLSFSGVAERLYVPFEAITQFSDPSVQFALQFETITEVQDEAPATADNTVVKSSDKTALKPKGKPRTPARHQPARADTPPAPVPLPANPPSGGPDDPPDKPGGEVVRLDRFRKK